MKKQLTALFFVLMGLPVASARTRAASPTARQVKAALDEQAENDLVSYLKAQPPGPAIGHVIPVDAITGLTCKPLQDKAVRCIFVVHRGLLDRRESLTLVRRGNAWHIADE